MEVLCCREEEIYDFIRQGLGLFIWWSLNIFSMALRLPCMTFGMDRDLFQPHFYFNAIFEAGEEKTNSKKKLATTWWTSLAKLTIQRYAAFCVWQDIWMLQDVNR